MHTFVVLCANSNTRAEFTRLPRKSTVGPHDILYLINAISAQPTWLILPYGLQADSNSICDKDGGKRGSHGGREQAEDNKLRLDVDLKKRETDEPRSAARKQTPGFVCASINILPLFSLPFSSRLSPHPLFHTPAIRLAHVLRHLGGLRRIHLSTFPPRRHFSLHITFSVRVSLPFSSLVLQPARSFASGTAQ